MPQEDVEIVSPSVTKLSEGDAVITPKPELSLPSKDRTLSASSQSSLSDTEMSIARSWSLSSGEMELQLATASSCNRVLEAGDSWNIPDTDSEDEFATKYQKQCPIGQTKSYPYPPPPAISKQEIRIYSRVCHKQQIPADVSNSKRCFENYANSIPDFKSKTSIPNTEPLTPSYPAFNARFNMPSDSEDEDPYSMAKSPTSSIASAAPPLPPPVSSIPRNDSSVRLPPASVTVIAPLTAQLSTTQLAPIVQPILPFQPFLSTQLPPPKPFLDLPQLPTAFRTQSLPLSPTSTTDTDPYDELDMDGTGAKSQPRYNFKLKKSKEAPVRLLISPSKDYAEISKPVTWNFPSSDEEDDSDLPNKPLASDDRSRRSSTTSSEGDRPMIPPKLWEIEAQREEVRRCSSDSGMKESNHEQAAAAAEISSDKRSGSETSVTIEYNPIDSDSNGRTGSLLGADDERPPPSPTPSQSSGFGDNQEFVEAGSALSDGSSKLQADYEQSSACVDMDQLSLDSSGNWPRRIVETHETHEIVPSENNEDDIIERIIETQTITEKLDEGTNFKDFSPEDFSKYLESDDEFVSHIFTLGRTVERGNTKQPKDKKDFAFLNPFGPSEPVTETIPIEKKTVKQKITTLVKKKRNMDEDNIYAEVTPSNLNLAANSLDTKLASGAETSRTSPKLPPRTVTNGDSSNTLHASGEIQQDSTDEDGKGSGDPKKKDVLKSEKRIWLFKGLKKLWKRRERLEQNKGLPIELEDDYQEFVP